MGKIYPVATHDESQVSVIRFPSREAPGNGDLVTFSRPRKLAAQAERRGKGWILYEGQPGLPWRSGNLYLEHDPDLAPVYARGLGKPGEYWRLRTMPQVRAALDDFVAAMVTPPWRLTRSSLPEWAQSDPDQVAAWDRQSALAERIWWHWSQLGGRGLRTLIAEKAEFAFVCGFSLHELALDRVEMDLGFGVRSYLFPTEIPEVRAPWSVRYWLTQGERPVACVQSLSHTQDRDGQTGPYEVVIPWEKLDHFALWQSGPTDLEGMSALRPARRPLQALQESYRLQALSIEVNGVGCMTLEKTDAQAPPLTEAQRSDVASFLESYKAEHMPWFIPPDGYKLSILSPQATVPDLSPAVELYERAASMALNQSHKLIGLQGHGSFAARASATSSAEEVYTLPVSRIADNLAGLLRRIIRANFPADDVIYTPVVDWSPLVQEGE